ncbi:arf-GAP with coiled-coil, ANK repeat and PH domain-containing protein 2 [Anopheles aquasalis]|uniref:arf-GAP with coiled-coil, ANK repeat and PH domain-containing protein 2 n=1 Tax=Anopheles aquasalis TaxID=42839 RepID=UPI00215A7B4A|nr:arf-GAP with coiled-coil, ANK repeat and PH domain-containing protein 2 [Anopheles aquasalis]XP_050084599.1 arf-GAP with coiled-coil, ANK repeat and PH domain-containing protein 2 [Anopheles aquasalis]XP_050084609.1 arf-GAP with coiled-coil, ANK repeat and PH domain-containing protein 2 [Anopheles aquasalis]XP_050084619.1 arf-GAP with coiled-coil, ANK repeat and PH domain-containing protein 2 [Anopheles aquasalis]
MARCKIDFGECLKDSPNFRLRIEQEEAEIEHLEVRLEKIIKACSVAVDSGKEYIRNQSTFATSLWDLQRHFQDDKSSTNALAQLIQLLQEMNKFHTTLLDQANRTVLKHLTGFLKRDIREVKEYRQIFGKVSENLDTAVYRNAQVNRNRASDVLEAENLLSATKSCFSHTALDYVNYITLLQSRKRHEVLATLLSYLQACSTYFHQGSDLCEDYSAFFKGLDDEIEQMRSEYASLDKQMQNRHTCVVEQASYVRGDAGGGGGGGGGGCSGGGGGTDQQHLEACPPSGDGKLSMPPSASSSSGDRAPSYMEGYLFKRTSNAFKTWNRRWFCMCDNQLFYRKRSGEELPTMMEEDLRICTVRQLADSDRRFCFEVISPTKTHILQADSEAMMNAWIKALQIGIDSAIQHYNPIPVNRNHRDGGGLRSSDLTRPLPGEGCGGGGGSSYSAGGGALESGGKGGPGNRKGFKKINWTQMLKIPGNSRCADCGNSEPRWASINLGITLCIACSGVHRSLGVHYSKVRSLTLDEWEPEILRVMIELGNDVINRVYEGNAAQIARFERATDNCEIAVREAWIRAKYIERQFVAPLDGDGVDFGLPGDHGGGANSSSTSSSTLSFKSLGADSSKFPEKWSIKKLRRRSYRQLLRPKRRLIAGVEGERVQVGDPAQLQIPVTDLGAEEQHRGAPDGDEGNDGGGGVASDGSGNAEGTSPDADEKDVKEGLPKQFADILLIGANIVTEGHQLPDEDLLLLNSDQESTSGEEDNSIMECEDLERLCPNYLLYKAASGHNLPVMSQALALGADKNWTNAEQADRTALHAAILSGSVMACEYLLLNGAAINATDRHGRTALHMATDQGSAAQAYLLLKHKARYDIADAEGHRPIDIAVEKEDADIVTLLRLTRLNDEISAGEDGSGYTGVDVTYAEVMNEFSHLASNQPQRIQRTQRQLQHQLQQQQQQQLQEQLLLIRQQESELLARQREALSIAADSDHRVTVTDLDVPNSLQTEPS